MTITGTVAEWREWTGLDIAASGAYVPEGAAAPVDIDLVADSAVNAGFGSAGERCMAISVVVAVEPVADELISKIKDRMSGLTVGDGTRGCDMGPLAAA